MSILKQGGEGLSGSPKKERSVRLADDAHHPSAPVSHEPASQSTSGKIGTKDEMGSRSRSADAGRSVDLSATMSGISVNMGNRDLKAEATQLVAFASSVQQQMDMFGDGQPQGGKIAVAYAQSCNALAKECLHDNMLRTSNELLEIAMHFLRTNHSMLVFLDHQRALAETHNNMGCLENKRGNLEVALKHILAAVEIETNLDWEVGHAATMLNACSTLSLLDRHAEALKAAQQAVDMLLAGEKEWDKLAAQPESTAGELLPVAFNNLALEFEFAGDREQALKSYEYSIMLATQRWGKDDERTNAIQVAAWEAGQEKVLGQFRVQKKLPLPPKSSWQLRYMLSRGCKALCGGAKTLRVADPRHQALLAVSQRLQATGRSTGTAAVVAPKKAHLPAIYAERNNLHRPGENTAGFHSPRFWSAKDGMAPRRASPFNKDMRQIGLEMCRGSGGTKQFINCIQHTPWGETRLHWEDTSEADLTIINGSVPSRTRLFSDVCSNSQMEMMNKLLRQRQQRVAQFPKDVCVFKKALVIRDTLRHSLPELR